MQVNIRARVEKLVLEPEPVADLPNKAARLIARLERTGEVVVQSHQPLVDGARELMARGSDPATLLTMPARRKGLRQLRA
jgi:hypothetical protein